MTTDTREALADLVMSVTQVMKAGAWIPTRLYQSFFASLEIARAALAAQAAQPSAQGEAVACVVDLDGSNSLLCWPDIASSTYPDRPKRDLVYASAPAAPAQAVPLTDEHISALWMSGWGAYCSRASFVAIFREAERAHGIAPKAAKETNAKLSGPNGPQEKQR